MKLTQTIKIIITLVISSITANAEVKFQVNLKNGIINITDDKIKMEVTTKIENILTHLLQILCSEIII